MKSTEFWIWRERSVITGLGSIASSGYSTFIIYLTGMAPGLFVLLLTLGNANPWMVLGIGYTAGAYLSLAAPVVGMVTLVVAYLVAKRSQFGKVTAISRARLSGLAVFALLPIIILAVSFTFIAPQLPEFGGPPPALRTLAPMEEGWREVETFSGRKGDRVTFATESLWRISLHAVPQVGRRAEFGFQVPFIPIGEGFLPLEYHATFAFEIRDTWPGYRDDGKSDYLPPGAFVMVIRADNLRMWNVRIEEKV